MNNSCNSCNYCICNQWPGGLHRSFFRLLVIIILFFSRSNKDVLTFTGALYSCSLLPLGLLVRERRPAVRCNIREENAALQTRVSGLESVGIAGSDSVMHTGASNVKF